MAFSWTVDWLKKAYLHGIDLTDDQGHPYPDEIFEQGLAEALEWGQTEFDVVLVDDASDPEADYLSVTDERHDYTPDVTREWCYLRTLKLPLRGKPTIRLMFGASEVVTIPESWVRVMRPESGQIQIIPQPGAAFPMQRLAFAFAHNLGFYQNVPGFFQLSYQAGWKTAEIPADLRGLLARFAAIAPLNIAGEMVAGAGVASFSNSMDGVSQSVSTTASATNAGYGARVQQYFKEIRRLTPIIYSRYHGSSKIAVC